MGTAATVFAMPYQTLLPVFARDILHAGPGGLGWLGAMGGAGAIAGSITVASFSNPKQLKALMITGGLGLGPFIALFAYSTLYLLSLLLVLVVGYLFQIFMTSNFTLVQIISPDYVRGRVLSIRMIAAGLAPVGMLMLGVGAETWGAPVATASMGILSLVLVCAILVGIPSVRRVETTMGEAAPTPAEETPAAATSS
jgi:MFS family permease